MDVEAFEEFAVTGGGFVGAFDVDGTGFESFPPEETKIQTTIASKICQEYFYFPQVYIHHRTTENTVYDLHKYRY